MDWVREWRVVYVVGIGGCRGGAWLGGAAWRLGGVGERNLVQRGWRMSRGICGVAVASLGKLSRSIKLAGDVDGRLPARLCWPCEAQED